MPCLSMKFTIRTVRPDDAEDIVRVLNPIIEAGSYTVFDAPLSAEQERCFITQFPSRGVFHVAERRDDGRIVGFQNLSPFADYTHAFDHVGVLATYVDLALRRQRIGTQLFEATLAVARQKGFEKAFTFIRADNTAALAAYLGQGFRVVGTAQRHARLKGQYIDEVLIERFL
jgi:L-amino acid N-acyltransferase YncA